MKKMKTKKIYIGLLLTGMMIMTGCLKDCVAPGNVTTENRSVDSFNAISAEDAFEVYVTKDSAVSLAIETNSGYQKHINAVVSGGVLTLSVDRSICPCNFRRLKAYVTVPSLSRIEASGASSIRCDSTYASENFSVTLSGASMAYVPLNVSGMIMLEASGASKAILNGNCGSLRVQSLSGASELNAFGLNADNAVVENSGASKAEVNVVNELEVTASGASEIIYMGNPRLIYKDVSGASEIKKK